MTTNAAGPAGVAGRTGQPRAIRRAGGVLAAAGIGAVLAIQSRVNGELGNRAHDGIVAATISFGGGLAVLAVVAAAWPAARLALRELADAVRRRELRPWQCLGGLCGAFLVLSQSLSAGLIGVALFTVAVVAGQVVSGLLVDRAGLGPGGRQPVTARRTAGAVCAVVAVVLAMSGQSALLPGGAGGAVWLVLLPALAGIGTAWQQAVNGRVKSVANSATAAALLNFLTGTIGLLVAFTVEVVAGGGPRSLPGNPLLYVGGALGIVVIGGSALLVRITGVLLLSMGMVVGQLVGALVLDLLLPTGNGAPSATTVIGIALTFVAAAVAAWPGRGLRSAGGQGLPESSA